MAAVLCVDDSDVALCVRKLLLESLGHTVITAESGEQALSLFQLAQFDLVLCDFHLPGMTGLETALEIKTLRKNTPIVLISGSIELPNHLPAVDACFMKGDAPERLLEIIAGILVSQERGTRDDTAAFSASAAS